LNAYQTRDQCLSDGSHSWSGTQCHSALEALLHPCPGEQRAARSPSASCPNGSRGPLSTDDPPTTAVRGRELFPRPDLRNSARARAGQRGARPRPEAPARARGGPPSLRGRERGAPSSPHAGPGPAMRRGPSSRARPGPGTVAGREGHRDGVHHVHVLYMYMSPYASLGPAAAPEGLDPSQRGGGGGLKKKKKRKAEESAERSPTRRRAARRRRRRGSCQSAAGGVRREGGLAPAPPPI
jgi:hypothetical protein